MPRISNRRQALDDVKELIVPAMVLSDECSHENDWVEDVALYYAWIEESRYFNRSARYAKGDDYFFTSKYYTMTDDRFRLRFRVTRQAFRTIARMIEHHPVFANNSNNSQLHPSWQLLVALTRLGHYGSRMAVELVADDMGISVGAVILYTDRVMAALVSLAPEWIRWPSYLERQRHGIRMSAEGFPRCVGFIDGTTLPLYQKPARHGMAYFDRKKRYSVNAQIICDIDRRIVGLDTGYPGSASDATVFKQMEHYQDPEEYFSPGEYLLADAAYGVTKTCVPPYKLPASKHPDNAAFNFYLACSRVRNEHTIGILKGRWQSLKELRHRLRDDDNMENLCLWVVSCCVLHNILLDIGDQWTASDNDHYVYKVRDYDELEMEPFIPDREATMTGLAFRESLKKTTLERNSIGM